MGTQDIADSIRPILFETELEDFRYATYGGTLFLVRFRGRPYALTCRHVFKDFQFRQLFVVGKKQAKKGDKPAPIQTICLPSSPRDQAVGTDIEDLCVIKFGDDLPADFFGDSLYVLDEKSTASSQIGHDLLVAGVLKDKMRIDPPDIQIGYCRLQFRDLGPVTSDPLLRSATAKFFQPQFQSITGISGAPAFDQTASALAGMVIRGGMLRDIANIHFIDIFDILQFLDSIHSNAPKTKYQKTVTRPAVSIRITLDP